MDVKVWRRHLLIVSVLVIAVLAFMGYGRKAFAAKDDPVTVSFDMQGHGTQISSDTTTWKVGNTIPNSWLPVPTAAGCVFRGWSMTKGVDDWAGDKMIPDVKTYVLYARWLTSSLTFVFNGNGSTGGTMNNQVLESGQSAVLTGNAFTRSGYTFRNWNTSADGTGTTYSNQQTVSYNNVTTADSTTITLYAQWNRRYAPVLMATATAVGAKKIRLNWANIDGAAFYVINRAKICPNSEMADDCDTDETDKTTAYAKKSAMAMNVSEVRRVPASQLGATLGGHAKNTSYKFRIDAYDASSQLICQSPEIYCYTGTMTGKTFAKNVVVDQPSVSMNTGSWRIIRANVNTKKKRDLPGFTGEVRFYSDNPGVATVNSDGQIIAVSPGSAVVYCVAENGRFATCAVYVNS